jgi:hypothetical protein
LLRGDSADAQYFLELRKTATRWCREAGWIEDALIAIGGNAAGLLNGSSTSAICKYSGAVSSGFFFSLIYRLSRVGT